MTSNKSRLFPFDELTRAHEVSSVEDTRRRMEQSSKTNELFRGYLPLELLDGQQRDKPAFIYFLEATAVAQTFCSWTLEPRKIL